jgi:hypothetical protein
MIVRTVTRDGISPDGRSRIAADAAVRFHMPLAILVDGQTASAAEIISGALQPLGNVTLVGQRTFGKGLVQQVMPMPDENLLKLTVAEYLLSDDRAINEKGIEPGVRLFPVPESRLGALANVPAGAIPYVRGTGEDDAFPVEVGATLLREPKEQALVEVRKRPTRTSRSTWRRWACRGRTSADRATCRCPSRSRSPSPRRGSSRASPARCASP